MNMPKDPVMLLSYINTQLRDNYESLEELSKSLSVDIDSINEKLNSIDYVYDPKKNKFV
ncbi:DUF4250 domain-containing protein [Lachnobacterium bovis]|uniref:DUF4250 domain-containing protein n=1 Tax=Lachnobacterium bovis TaxID=140626 RepID=A0A1H9P2Z6_9FIRM|nr:DUF4250 domain-containing protein [Lachnobacterium bovis]SER42570.1 protein of unknown function [Lachnobacterium bovis]